MTPLYVVREVIVISVIPDLVHRYSCGAIAEWQRVASAENIAGRRSSDDRRDSSGGGGDGTVGPMGLGRRVVGANGAVRPHRHCLPRHPTHFTYSFLE